MSQTSTQTRMQLELRDMIFYRVALCIGITVFILLRTVYWQGVHEIPFSDMADFERIAKGILGSFSFQYDAFWKSYKSPTLPLLGAMVWGVAGLENYFAWRIFQLGLVLLGVLWLAREVRLATRMPVLAVVLVWSIALSRPSIFWSYKYATEAVAEGLLYLCSAGAMCACRTGRGWIAFLTGVLCTVCTLNRPNYVVLIPAIAILLFLSPAFPCLQKIGFKPACPRTPRFFSRLLLSGVFTVGVLVAWMPWIVRGYGLYGEFLPTNTSGGHSFVFDLGKISVTLPDGEVVNHTNDELLTEAPSRFANDFLSHKHAEAIFAAWYLQDPARYWRIVQDRFFVTLTEHNVYLTTLSRTELYGDWKDRILLDKTPWLLLAGFLVLVVLSLRIGSGISILPWVAAAPWLLAIMVASTSRYLDPMVPLLSFGWVAGVCVLLRHGVRAFGGQSQKLLKQ